MSLTNAALATALCLNITGTYSDDAGLPLKYEQTGCESIAIFHPIRLPDSSILYESADLFTLNGLPVCATPGQCKFAKIERDGILLKRSFNTTVNAASHGPCLTTESKLSLDEKENLITDLTVFNCEDGFFGHLRKVFQRL